MVRVTTIEAKVIFSSISTLCINKRFENRVSLSLLGHKYWLPRNTVSYKVGWVDIDVAYRCKD